MVGERLANQGESLPIDGKILALLDTSHVEVTAQMPAADVVRLKVGQTARVTLEGFSDRVFDGRITRISPTAQPGSRSIPVYVEIVDRHDALRGGLFATGTVVVQEKSHALAVPVSAMRKDDQGDFVLAVDNGALARKPDGSPFSLDLLGGPRGRQPSFFAPELLTHTERYFARLAPIVQRFVHQQPTIISIQIDNETNFYFSDRYKSDYSSHGLAQYRAFLRARYGTIVVVTAFATAPIPKGCVGSRITNVADRLAPTSGGAIGRFTIAVAFPAASVEPMKLTNVPGGTSAPNSLFRYGWFSGMCTPPGFKVIPGDVPASDTSSA